MLAGLATAVLICVFIALSFKPVRDALFRPQPFLQLVCTNIYGNEMHMEIRFPTCAYEASSLRTSKCNTFFCTYFVVAGDGIHYDAEDAQRACSLAFRENDIPRVLKAHSRQRQETILHRIAERIDAKFSQKWSACSTALKIDFVPEPSSVMPEDAAIDDLGDMDEFMPDEIQHM